MDSQGVKSVIDTLTEVTAKLEEPASKIWKMCVQARSTEIEIEIRQYILFLIIPFVLLCYAGTVSRMHFEHTILTNQDYKTCIKYCPEPGCKTDYPPSIEDRGLTDESVTRS